MELWTAFTILKLGVWTPGPSVMAVVVGKACSWRRCVSTRQAEGC